MPESRNTLNEIALVAKVRIFVDEIVYLLFNVGNLHVEKCEMIFDRLANELIGDRSFEPVRFLRAHIEQRFTAAYKSLQRNELCPWRAPWSRIVHQTEARDKRRIGLVGFRTLTFTTTEVPDALRVHEAHLMTALVEFCSECFAPRDRFKKRAMPAVKPVMKPADQSVTVVILDCGGHRNVVTHVPAEPGGMARSGHERASRDAERKLAAGSLKHHDRRGKNNGDTRSHGSHDPWQAAAC